MHGVEQGIGWTCKTKFCHRTQSSFPKFLQGCCCWPFWVSVLLKGRARPTAVVVGPKSIRADRYDSFDTLISRFRSMHRRWIDLKRSAQGQASFVLDWMSATRVSSGRKKSLNEWDFCWWTGSVVWLVIHFVNFQSHCHFNFRESRQTVI